MPRSATGSTVVVALAELFAEFGSPTPEVTLASFVMEPVDGGVTLIVALAFAPFATVPSAQVTTPPDCEQVPCEAVAELNATPDGSVSERLTLVALEGPLLCTLSV
jgi:hypothetical protein